MRWIERGRLRARSLLFRARVERELDDEIRFHVEQQFQENLAAGMNPQQARLAAVRVIGGADQMKEECRDKRRINFVDNLVADIRFGLRMLLKNPGFAAVAVVTLGLGIGATTAIFTVVDSVLVRPLEYPDAARIVKLEPFRGGKQAQVSPANFLDWREEAQSYESMAAVFVRGANLLAKDEPERVQLSITSASFFSVLGAGPSLGREFSSEDEKAGHKPVAIISQGLWRRRFNSDAAAIGSQLTIDGQIYEIIGVTPAALDYPAGTEVWLPPARLVPELNQNIGDPAKVRGLGYLSVIARLKPNVSTAQAQSEIDTLNTRLDQSYPDANRGFTARVSRLQDSLVGSIRPVLILLLCAVGSLLLIACVNIANLMLARATARRREIAIRASLGANGFRLIQQLLTESILLALAGGVLGALLAQAGLVALLALSKDIPRAGEIHLDLRVLLFTLAVSLAAGILFGLAPALTGSGTAASDALRQDPRGGVRHGALRNILITVEMALSLMLLIGAGLLFRSFMDLALVKPGFVPEHLLTFKAAPSGNDYKDTGQQTRFYSNLIQGLEALPGVQAAGAIDTLPLSKGPLYGFFIQSRPPYTAETRRAANYRSITPGYFRAMGIHLIEGRTLLDTDDATSPAVIIINQALAHRDFSDQDPVGQKLGFGAPNPSWAEVVGVVADVKNDQMATGSQPEVYAPYQQSTFPVMSFAVRSSLSPAVLASEVRQAARAVDRRLPVSDFRSMDQVVANAVSQPRFNMVLLVSFAGIALLLAAAGIYGVMSYIVSQQSHEIGVRVALGARYTNILAGVMARGLKVAVTGAVMGLAAAFAFTRLMTGLLFGVKAVDPLTYGVVPVFLISVAAVACYFPARRGARIDPASALRRE